MRTAVATVLACLLVWSRVEAQAPPARLRSVVVREAQPQLPAWRADDGRDVVSTLGGSVVGAAVGGATLGGVGYLLGQAEDRRNPDAYIPASGVYAVFGVMAGVTVGAPVGAWLAGGNRRRGALSRPVVASIVTGVAGYGLVGALTRGTEGRSLALAPLVPVAQVVVSTALAR